MALCMKTITEFRYFSTCFVYFFDSASKSTYLIWILFQFPRSGQIKFIITLFMCSEEHRWSLKWSPNSIGKNIFAKEILLGLGLNYRWLGPDGPKQGLGHFRQGGVTKKWLDFDVCFRICWGHFTINIQTNRLKIFEQTASTNFFYSSFENAENPYQFKKIDHFV